jgi:hypothetical protein
MEISHVLSLHTTINGQLDRHICKTSSGNWTRNTEELTSDFLNEVKIKMATYYPTVSIWDDIHQHNIPTAMTLPSIDINAGGAHLQSLEIELLMSIQVNLEEDSNICKNSAWLACALGGKVPLGTTGV